MKVLFELVMRYCDYSTFKKCSLLNRECNRICRKMVPELRRIKRYNDYYESYHVYWNGKKEGLSYYVNENYLKILDYSNDEVIAIYVYNIVSEYITINDKKYETRLDFSQKKVLFLTLIPYYSRQYLSLSPIENSSFF